MFDWKRFLDSHGVEWSESGVNVSRTHIGICCPWCGPLDDNFHMGINPETGMWSCWKDSTHRGKEPFYLIQRIAKCSRAEAEAIWEGDYLGDVQLAEIERLLNQKPKPFKPKEVCFTRHEFLLGHSRHSQRFFTYLKNRGFDDPEAVSKEYGLRGAVLGSFAHRVIFPINIDGILVGWTARAITSSPLRYKAYPSGDLAVGSKVIYNFDKASLGGEVLVLVEGTVDTLKLDFYGKEFGVRAVGLLGIKLTDKKAKLLFRLAPKFQKLVVVLDQNATGQAMDVLDKLVHLDNVSLSIMEGAKDPGELSQTEILRFLETIV